MTSVPSFGFATLAALQDNHAILVKEVGKDVLAPGNLERIVDFVMKGVATGTILDASADRIAAQSLITFWASRAVAACRDDAFKKLWERHQAAASVGHQEIAADFEDTLLADFSPDALQAAVIDPVDRWWNQQQPLEKNFAKRILLRLVRLRERDDSVEVRSSATGVCDGLEPVDKAEEVLIELIKLGVVRTVRSTESVQDEVALRSPAVLERWALLQTWIDGRRQFRQKALQWVHKQTEDAAQSSPSLLGRVVAACQFGAQSVGAWIEYLLSGTMSRLKIHKHADDERLALEVEEAETYRDRTPDEMKFIYQKRLREKERRTRRRLVTTGIGSVIAVSVFTVLLAYAVEERNKAIDEWGKSKVALESAQEAEEESQAQKKRADEERRLRDAEFLISQTMEIIATKPQQSAILAYLAFQSARTESSDGTMNDHERLNRRAEETLGKALANLGGMGFYAEVGAVTHIAAHEVQFPEKRTELRWLAAAGTKGSIALWDLKKESGKQTAEILPFGYAPPIRNLFITKDGQFLVVVSDRNNVSCWDLNSKPRACRVLETGRYGEFRSSTGGGWLEADNGISEGILIRCGSGPQRLTKYPFDVYESEPKIAQARPLLGPYSFSRDERWFARVTTKGEAYVWDLAQPNPRPQKLPHAVPAMDDVTAVNGEFLNGSKRLVVYLSNGAARYWDLDGHTWTAAPQDIMLKDNARVFTNRRGTHAILVPKAKPDSASNVTVPDAYCFDGKDLGAPDQRGAILKDFDDRFLSGQPELDDTGRWLIGKFTPDGKQQRVFLRIWDLQTGKKDGVVPAIAPSDPNEILDTKPLQEFPAIAIRGIDNVVRLLDLNAPRSWRALRGNDGAVQLLAQSQNGHFLISGAQDGALRVWNLNPLSASVEPLVYQSFPPSRFVTVPNGRWLALSLPDGWMKFKRIRHGAVSMDRADNLWIAEDGQKHADESPDLAHFKAGNHKGASELSSSTDGRWMLEKFPQSPSASLWDLQSEEPRHVCKLDVGAEPIQRILATKDGAWFAAQTSKKKAPTVLLWDLKTTKKGGAAPRTREIPGLLLDFLPDNTKALIRGPAKIECWTLAIDRPDAPDVIWDAKTNIAFALSSPNADQVIVSSYVTAPNQLESFVIDMGSNTKHKLRSFYPYGDTYFSPNGKHICSLAPGPSGTSGGLFPRYWTFTGVNSPPDTDLPRHSFHATKESRAASVLARSDDHRWLVTLENESGFLWDLANELPGVSEPRNLGKIGHARISSDSAWLVTANDGALALYDLKKPGTLPLKIPDADFRGELISLAVTPEGTKLALVGKDLNIYLWSLKEGAHPRSKILAPGTFGIPTQMYFSSDERRIYSYSAAPSSLRVSRFQNVDFRNIVAEAVGRDLSETEWLLPNEKYRRTFEELPVPGAKLDDIPNVPLAGKLQDDLKPFDSRKIVPDATIKIAGKSGELLARQLDERAPQTLLAVPGFYAISGPCLAYTIRLPGKTTCQIDLKSSDFAGGLGLEDHDHKLFAIASAVGERTRIIFNTRDDGGDYKILVIGTRGKAGSFDLRVQLQ